MQTSFQKRCKIYTFVIKWLANFSQDNNSEFLYFFSLIVLVKVFNDFQTINSFGNKRNRVRKKRKKTFSQSGPASILEYQYPYQLPRLNKMVARKSTLLQHTRYRLIIIMLMGTWEAKIRLGGNPNPVVVLQRGRLEIHRSAFPRINGCCIKSHTLLMHLNLYI